LEELERSLIKVIILTMIVCGELVIPLFILKVCFLLVVVVEVCELPGLEVVLERSSQEHG
jgi:hypothetical protein